MFTLKSWAVQIFRRILGHEIEINTIRSLEEAYPLKIIQSCIRVPPSSAPYVMFCVVVKRPRSEDWLLHE